MPSRSLMPRRFDAAAQKRERRVVRYAFDLGEISLLRPVARISDPFLECAIVGEEYQTLAVIVEPPRRIDTLHRDEVGQRAPARPVGELAEHVERLVEGDQHGLR
jgi:hypothetical protein